ncbi:hypothetical protein PLICRDRAFT_554424 [Plicaturopsis crispa FD-325 SS-3]|nr:hypothetical protein PLICRDRAFT_554424 [Plicaturopsis crispa FD-325 SS-3]
MPSPPLRHISTPDSAGDYVAEHSTSTHSIPPTTSRRAPRTYSSVASASPSLGVSRNTSTASIPWNRSNATVASITSTSPLIRRPRPPRSTPDRLLEISGQSEADPSMRMAAPPKDYEAAFAKLSSSHGFGGTLPALPRKKDKTNLRPGSANVARSVSDRSLSPTPTVTSNTTMTPVSPAAPKARPATHQGSPGTSAAGPSSAAGTMPKGYEASFGKLFSSYGFGGDIPTPPIAPDKPDSSEEEDEKVAKKRDKSRFSFFSFMKKKK